MFSPRILVVLRSLTGSIFKFFRFNQFRFSSIILMLIAVFACTSIAVGARIWFAKSATGGGSIGAASAESPESSTKAMTVPGQSSQTLESELIAVNSFGFEPAEIKRPAGEFILVIKHLGDLTSLSLSLSLMEDDAPVRQVKVIEMKSGQTNCVNQFNLPAGEYVLSVANHPDWKCKVTLTP